MKKSRVASIKYVIIPKLELITAVLAINMSQGMKRNMDVSSYPCIKLLFWTESQMVPGYIQDEVKNLKIFFENWVKIH